MILLLSASAGGYYLYDNYLAKHEIRNDFSAIPNDPIFIIESKNLSKAWTTISESKIWQYLLKNPYFADINEYADLMDKFLANNKAMDLLLSNRSILISAHMISGIDYDFLFVIDLQSSKAISKSFDDALNLIEGFHIRKRKYHNIEVVEFIDNEDASNTIYFYLLDNLLVASYTAVLIEKSIDQKDLKYWENNQSLIELSDNLSARKLLKLYFNYKQLPRFMNVYMEDSNEYSQALAQALRFSLFHINLEDEQLSFNGYTVPDTIPTYISALTDVKPGKMRAFNIISDQAAMYLSIGFKSYNMFYLSLIDQYARENPEELKEYEKNVERLEKYLGINIKEDFYSWIGEEITFIKLRPQKNTRIEDVVVSIHANDIDKAKAGFNKIAERIKKRSPAKFKSTKYRNFEIKYLEIKGFFKLFLGKLFKDLEKPYITYIEDFMVISNSESTLKQLIDDYITGHTLSHNQNFIDFKDNFNAKSNISVFLQMPKIYTNLYHFSNSGTKKSVKENKELILSFNQIGIQLIADGDIFKTLIIAAHDPEAALNDELEKLEQQTSKALSLEYFDSLRFKITLPDSVLNRNGSFKKQYPSTETTYFEGNISNNQLNGIWRTYYPSGNLQSTVNYNNGQVDGDAYFYYDDDKNTKMAEVHYSNDLIDGPYMEYYENGAQKALLHYESGLLNGPAEYYYKTGRTKIKGKYKNGRKKGKWYFYDEKGNLINKIRE